MLPIKDNYFFNLSEKFDEKQMSLNVVRNENIN